MEIPNDKFVALFVMVMNNFKKLDSELLAYKMTVAALKQTGPTQECGQLFEQALAGC